ncbi:hypothetical protein [Bacteroides intestinalis]|nr:hypothetical protein [Bacteroides intestinalis]
MAKAEVLFKIIRKWEGGWSDFLSFFPLFSAFSFVPETKGFFYGYH